MSEIRDSGYVNLALKYRPRLLVDLVGQDVFAKTIKNATEKGTVSDVFMLYGPSGSGKTTSARILALSVNCDKGITPNPCMKCKNCIDILKGAHPDVFEMDAASRTGIDDIRNIISSANYTPMIGRYKIYIIDEVHMLSQNAFNGLLKTLEQPPPHTKFIFATTEIRKVPDTIVSRCQNFCFTKIHRDDIATSIEEVSKKEGISIDRSAVSVISDKSNGSLRNALMMLDQIASYCENNITADEARKVLGEIKEETSFLLLEHILDRQINAALELTDKLQRNFEAGNILRNLASSVYKLTEFDLTGVIDEKLSTQAKTLLLKSNRPLLIRIWQVIHNCINEIKEACDEYISVKMSIIKLCILSGLPSPGQIAKGLSRKNVQTETTEKTQGKDFQDKIKEQPILQNHRVQNHEHKQKFEAMQDQSLKCESKHLSANDRAASEVNHAKDEVFEQEKAEPTKMREIATDKKTKMLMEAFTKGRIDSIKPQE